MVKALVIGYGSIGARHARLLAELGCATAVVSRRRVDFPIVYPDLISALSGHRPDYVVLANSTNQHHETVRELASAGFDGSVLVEKPLFDHCQPIPTVSFARFFVAYNLRFHPVILRLREILVGEKLLSVQAYVGQYLPDWRPGTDYRQSYSASAAHGGGALRDLSHELDYLGWLCGDWTVLTALGGHVSALEIDSDDLFVLLMQSERCPVVTIQVSYLDRVARRWIVINTQEHTIEADVLNGTLAINGVNETMVVERDQTYREMHQAMLSEDFGNLCTAEAALATLQMIESAECANRQRKWVTR
jgi:predicted dehydrogenase